MIGDTSLIPTTMLEFFPEFQDVERIRSSLFSVSGGYAHCWVIRKKGFFSLYGAPGIARFTATTRKSAEGSQETHGSWTIRMESRISMGYNSDNYFGGILLSSFLNNQNLETGARFAYGFQTVRIFFGKRFALKREVGHLGL